MRNRRMILSLALLLLIIASTFGITYAYFRTRKEHGIIIETGEFNVELMIYFDDLLIDQNSPYYDPVKKQVIINAFDVTAKNYIGDLRITMVIHPQVASRFRIKLMDQWEMRRVFINQSETDPIPDIVENLYFEPKSNLYYPHSLLRMNPDFTYIYAPDGYLYFDKILRKNQIETIDIIQGGDPYPVRFNEVFQETVYVYIDIFIDIVQANRFSEVWGIPRDFYQP